jgi:hypothetical protein
MAYQVLSVLRACQIELPGNVLPWHDTESRLETLEGPYVNSERYKLFVMT